MKIDKEYLVLTPKGVDEMRARTDHLDARAKSVLALIEQGVLTGAALQQRSKLRREDLLDVLRILLTGRFANVAYSDAVDLSHGTGVTPGGSNSIWGPLARASRWIAWRWNWRSGNARRFC